MLTVWVLAVYGTTAIVTESKIFAPVRAWASRRWAWLGSLLGCAMCFGWWCGAGLSVLGWSPAAGAGPAWWPWWLRAILDGAASSAVSWAASVLVGTVLELRFTLETWRFGEESRQAERRGDGPPAE
jgi:hypothetical protein